MKSISGAVDRSCLSVGKPIAVLFAGTNVLLDKNGLPYVIPYTSVKYNSPNDVTNNCNCDTAYQKIGSDWYCKK